MPAKQTIFLTHAGETHPLDEWARRTNLPPSTILSRLRKLRWPVARALTTPPDRRFRKGGRRKLGGIRPCPTLERHTKGYAYCRWRADGGRHMKYFGPWGSAEADAAYNRFAAEWHASQGRPKPAAGQAVFVADVCLRYQAWADGYYTKNGKPTSETHVVTRALCAVNGLYGDTPAAEFEPDRLRAVKEKWIAAGLARKTVNEYAARVKKMFRWASSRSLVPAAVADALAHVEAEAKGRTRAKESARKRSVSPAIVEATLPHLHADEARRQVLEAMVRVQLLGGLRPGEVCSMHPEHIDRTDPAAWSFDVGRANKTLHLDRERVVWFGPQAQTVLRPFLDSAEPGRPVFRFDPRRIRSGWVGAISVAVYSQLVKDACERAKVPAWTPHQLRKTRATLVRDHYRSAKAGAVAIGDELETAIRHYLDPDTETARRIAMELG